MYNETFSRWNVDLLLGLAYFSRRRVTGENAHSASDIAASGYPISLHLSPEARRKLMVELTEIRRYMIYCKGLKLKHEEAQAQFWKDSLGCSTFTIFRQQPVAGILRPAFAVICDHSLHAIVFCVRGTRSAKDVFTSLAGHARPHHVCPRDAEASPVLGYCHVGMLAAARWLLKQAVPVVVQALVACPEYELKIAGHSMGGGAAAILTMMLREDAFLDTPLAHPVSSRVAAARCYAIACPSCLTYELAEYCSDFVTTVVNAADVIPTFSAVTVDELRTTVAGAQWRAKFGEDMRTTWRSGVTKLSYNSRQWAGGISKRWIPTKKVSYGVSSSSSSFAQTMSSIPNPFAACYPSSIASSSSSSSAPVLAARRGGEGGMEGNSSRSFINALLGIGNDERKENYGSSYKGSGSLTMSREGAGTPSSNITNAAISHTTSTSTTVARSSDCNSDVNTNSANGDNKNDSRNKNDGSSLLTVSRNLENINAADAMPLYVTSEQFVRRRVVHVGGNRRTNNSGGGLGLGGWLSNWNVFRVCQQPRHLSTISGAHEEGTTRNNGNNDSKKPQEGLSGLPSDAMSREGPLKTISNDSNNSSNINSSSSSRSNSNSNNSNDHSSIHSNSNFNFIKNNNNIEIANSSMIYNATVCKKTSTSSKPSIHQQIDHHHRSYHHPKGKKVMVLKDDEMDEDISLRKDGSISVGGFDGEQSEDEEDAEDDVIDEEEDEEDKSIRFSIGHFLGLKSLNSRGDQLCNNGLQRTLLSEASSLQSGSPQSEGNGGIWKRKVSGIMDINSITPIIP
eukprot:CAMPEP_0175039566 /NCGR_PEP_ID=MMETSP0052_2-20121109/672_1 /TAXON_ID=51329 ORGANISM="Polytomella parva, Strain SAG 63-3" /NCGR_SAMPLE_ID=MMETSP0052_2 /ASSEMBLY_ACC=CAM_ASM_000194 /LENGTH=792 /DNA_ID=CAMNT_0016301467 /DNA_START=245 /DNA_END=2619 /DNA_ORIENTATION=-